MGLENYKGFKVIAILTMLYITIMIFDAVMTNRYIGGNSLYILGGTLSSPLIFLLDDLLTEIYGYNIARVVIIAGFVCQTFFSLGAYFVVTSHHPSFVSGTAFPEMLNNSHYYYDSYQMIFGMSLLRINFSGFLAYFVANLINSKLLSRWKWLVKGKKYWLRSLGSSGIAEALYTFIAIMMMELKSIPLNGVFKIVLISYFIKLFFDAITCYPAQLLVNYLKGYTGIDVFDIPKKFRASQIKL